jgi:hypothetical protein
VRRRALVLIAFVLTISWTALSATPVHAASARPTVRNPACYSVETGPAGSLASVAAQAPLGVYLWLDAAGWHIRVTHPGDEAEVFTGQILACNPIQVASRLTATGDGVAIADSVPLGYTNETALAFRLTDYGPLDGFEFNATCPTTFTFSFQVNGVDIPSSEIHVGALDVHPSASTFALPSCPASPVPAFALQTENLQDTGSLSLIGVGGLRQVPLLPETQTGLDYIPLQLPVRARPLFGDPANKPASFVTTTHGRGIEHDALASTAVVLEVGLGLALCAGWLLARRSRKATS